MTQPETSFRDSAPLSPEDWAQLRALVDAVLAMPTEKRPGFLATSCGDEAQRKRVERLVAGYERAESSWGFLAHPAGDLVAPLLLADKTLIGDAAVRSREPPPALRAALADRYAVGQEIGRGGMASVYVAEDLRHHRRVALKVVDPELGAMLGADRFLSEIRVTAGLQHLNILPLYDSGEAGGLLYYVMPLIEGATLRERLASARQLPVDDAVRIVSTIAGALDYAHKRGIVHRDLKPENILLQDDQPLVADFGISLAMANASDSRVTGAGISMGTPQYMSPEQANGDPALDARSDIFSLACVLYELLTGDPPFTGSTVSAVIARLRTDTPPSVRTVRPSVPVHVEIALVRALEKVPADRFATVREFADALVLPGASAATPAKASRWRLFPRIALGAAAIFALATVGWKTLQKAPAPSWFVEANLIDPTHRSGVTITPDGSAFVYTGPVEAGRPIMVRPIGQIASHAIRGTEGGYMPFVSPDGQRLLFTSRSAKLALASIDGVARASSANAWRYGSGAWVDDSVIVTQFGTAGLAKGVPSRATFSDFTRPVPANGKHGAPLRIPGTRLVVFTASRVGGPRLIVGDLAIASLDDGRDSIAPHALLGITARRAIAFVDGWLLYISENGKSIMANRLDLARRRVVGTPLAVLDDTVGNLEDGVIADNGTLMYLRRPRGNSVLLVDAKGAVRPILASADEAFMYPRISPDGKRFAMQITAGSRSDIWVFDIASATPKQLTTTGRALHPAWTPDGRRIVFMAGGEWLESQPVDGGPAERIPGTRLPFGPSVTADGRSVVYQRRSDHEWTIWSESLDGKIARQVMDDPFPNYMPAVSPDGRWIAYVSKATGSEEVYARPFTGRGPAVQISQGGGIEPAWSPDGHNIYYHIRSILMSVAVTPALAITSRTTLFKGAFDEHLMPHRNYDVAPDGSGFLMIAPPRNPETVYALNWLPELRAHLARAR